MLILTVAACSDIVDHPSSRDHSKNLSKEGLYKGGSEANSDTGQNFKLPPVDDGQNDPSFVTFREKLLDAVRTRNAQFILDHVDNNVFNSFGGDPGKENFEKKWTLDNDESKFWTEMSLLLVMGGSFIKDPDEREVFCAPYVVSEWTKVAEKVLDHYRNLHDIESENGGAVLEEGVSLRSSPNADAKTIGILSYDIVFIDTPLPNAQWYKVYTGKGASGYVEAKKIRLFTDYVACFIKKGDTWFITRMSAGD